MKRALLGTWHRRCFSPTLRWRRTFVVVATLTAVTLLLIYASSRIGVAAFTTDSWSYFELAKTVFTDDFFVFTTFRSYFSEKYSASFPLGYPLVLAVAHLFTGVRPFAAVMVNILAAIGTIVLIFRVSSQLKVSISVSVALILALVFYPFYLDEVFAGRSIPLACFALLAGMYAAWRQRPAWAGFLVACSILLRFDFLVLGFLSLLAMAFAFRSHFKKTALMWVGVVFGLAPWIAYSYSHFGTLWVSDNSWVALSALPASVLDYPARARISIQDDPGMWFSRVIGNLTALRKSVWASSHQFPLVFFLLAFFFANLTHLSRKNIGLTTTLLLLCVASLAPYLLTGYFHGRYLTAFFLSASAVLVVAIHFMESPKFLGLSVECICVLSLLATLPSGLQHLQNDIAKGSQKAKLMEHRDQQISALFSCHRQQPKERYVFTLNNTRFAAMYGAVSGMPSAIMPSNFHKLTPQQKKNYVEHMKPYMRIDNLARIKPCLSQDNFHKVNDE